MQLETYLPDLLDMVISSKAWPQLQAYNLHLELFVKIYELVC